MQPISKLALLTVLSAAMVAPVRAGQGAEKPKAKYTRMEKVAGAGLVVGTAIIGYLTITGDATIALGQLYDYLNTNHPTEGDLFHLKKESPTLVALGITGLGMVAAGALLIKERMARKKGEQQSKEA